jgi:hypothetical protein
LSTRPLAKLYVIALLNPNPQLHVVFISLPLLSKHHSFAVLFLSLGTATDLLHIKCKQNNEIKCLPIGKKNQNKNFARQNPFVARVL